MLPRFVLFLLMSLLASAQTRRQTFLAGRALTPEDVAALEAAIRRNPEDLNARGQLLSYYFARGTQGDESTAAEAEAARLPHILWIIEHHPESRLAGSIEATIFPAGTRMTGPADYEKARELWLKTVDLHPGDARVLGNAAMFLQFSDRELSAYFFKLAMKADPANPEWPARLGNLYALALVDRVGPMSYGIDPPPGETLAESARGELEKSDNARVVGAAATSLAMYVERLKSMNRPAGDLNVLARELLRKAQKLDPGNPEWNPQPR